MIVSVFAVHVAKLIKKIKKTMLVVKIKEKNQDNNLKRCLQQ